MSETDDFDFFWVDCHDDHDKARVPRGPISTEAAIEALESMHDTNIYFCSSNKTGLLQMRLWDVIGDARKVLTVRDSGVMYLGLRGMSTDELGRMEGSVDIVKHLACITDRLEFRRSFCDPRCENDMTLVVALADVDE